MMICFENQPIHATQLSALMLSKSVCGQCVSQCQQDFACSRIFIPRGINLYLTPTQNEIRSFKNQVTSTFWCMMRDSEMKSSYSKNSLKLCLIQSWWVFSQFSIVFGVISQMPKWLFIVAMTCNFLKIISGVVSKKHLQYSRRNYKQGEIFTMADIRWECQSWRQHKKDTSVQEHTRV